MDFRHLLEKAKNLEKALSELDENLKAHVTEGSAGSGAVTVKVNGAGDVIAMTLDPQLVATGDTSLIESTILAALRQATEASRAYREAQRARLVGGLELPEF
jgi:DNA-binding YbaB/EbfC family protein